MTLQESMKSVYDLKKQKEFFEEEVEKLKNKISEIEKQLDIFNNDIMQSLKESNEVEVEYDGLFVNLFSKDNVGYSNEDDVIKYLEDNDFNRFIKVKKSLDKNNLKKELKTNGKLAEALNAMLVTKTTEYVVVTDAENHEKMLGHIEENKKGN